MTQVIVVSVCCVKVVQQTGQLFAIRARRHACAASRDTAPHQPPCATRLWQQRETVACKAPTPNPIGGVLFKKGTLDGQWGGATLTLTGGH